MNRIGLITFGGRPAPTYAALRSCAKGPLGKREPLPSFAASVGLPPRAGLVQEHAAALATFSRIVSLQVRRTSGFRGRDIPASARRASFSNACALLDDLSRD
jgi:hypothetical protein